MIAICQDFNIQLNLGEEQDLRLHAPLSETGVENPAKKIHHNMNAINDEAGHKDYEKMWRHICYGFLQKWKFQEDGTTILHGYMKLSKSKEYIFVVEDERNEFLQKMEQERRNLKLPDSFIECMKKNFNDTVNKNDDSSVVPQEDFLNHKPLVPAKLKLPSSFEETLEALRQEWYDLAYPSYGELCQVELDLKRLSWKEQGEITYGQIIIFRICHEHTMKSGSKPNSVSCILNLSMLS
ncbi:hypothetical protein R1flu_020669 [Riccia fluitans]|uniref:Uncharacterized protein n=1 Tax=Riccia fluitans TaxID=41844 RepID=A0ABD1ZNT1_9MARC